MRIDHELVTPEELHPGDLFVLGPWEEFQESLDDSANPACNVWLRTHGDVEALLPVTAVGILINRISINGEDEGKIPAIWHTLVAEEVLSESVA